MKKLSSKLLLILALTVCSSANALSPTFEAKFIYDAIAFCKPNKGLKHIKWTDSLFTGTVTVMCNNGAKIEQ